ncbi:MAG: hypothetical protein LBI20_02850, partial [Holosporales bacterium]|nr:hypothetical protein [Holosporales bacterium]
SIGQSLSTISTDFKNAIESVLREEMEKTNKALDKSSKIATAGVAIGAVATLGLAVMGGYSLWSRTHQKQLAP